VAALRRATAAARPDRARVRVAWVVAALVAGVLAGRLGAGSWDGTQTVDPAPDGEVASAVVLDVRPAGGTPARTPVDLVVRVTSLDRTALVVVGGEAGFDAGTIESVVPNGMRIDPGGSGLVTVHAGIACGSRQPLRLGDLQVRRADHRIRTITITGASGALASLCDLQTPGAHPLALVSALPDDTRMRLAVRSPTGRTTRVTAIGVDGVPFTGRPLPATVGAQQTEIWLNRPASCPAAWVNGGLPRTVDVDLDAGGPATVTLDVGFALARWLRAGPCAAAVPAPSGSPTAAAGTPSATAGTPTAASAGGSASGAGG
jgi:hypothetical protein